MPKGVVEFIGVSADEKEKFVGLCPHESVDSSGFNILEIVERECLDNSERTSLAFTYIARLPPKTHVYDIKFIPCGNFNEESSASNFSEVQGFTTRRYFTQLSIGEIYELLPKYSPAENTSLGVEACSSGVLTSAIEEEKQEEASKDVRQVSIEEIIANLPDLSDARLPKIKQPQPSYWEAWRDQSLATHALSAFLLLLGGALMITAGPVDMPALSQHLRTFVGAGLVLAAAVVSALSARHTFFAIPKQDLGKEFGKEDQQILLPDLNK